MDDLEARLRAAVRQQADGLTPAPDLPDRIRARVARRRRQRRVMAGALTTAAVALGAVALVAAIARPGGQESVEVSGDRTATTAPEPTQRTTPTTEPTTSTGSTSTTGTVGTTTTDGGDGDGDGGSPATSDTPPGGAPPGTAATTTSTSQPPDLRPPDGGTPAAGTCAAPSGSTVEIVIHPDVPDPRCAQVTADQRLQIRNAAGEVISVSFADFSAELAPGTSQVYDRPFGEYLQPGVHRVTVSLYGESGPEIWLMP